VHQVFKTIDIRSYKTRAKQTGFFIMKPILPITLLLMAGFTHNLSYAAKESDHGHEEQHAHDDEQAHQANNKSDDNHDHEKEHNNTEEHSGEHADEKSHQHEDEQDHDKAHGDKDDHGDDHGDEGGHEEELTTKINRNIAVQVGIQTALPRSQVLNQSIISYGSLTTGPTQLSHVRARYTGLIKSVKPDIGDAVKRGDLLARVESNESLKVYNILAPIAGTIIQRHANTGEVTEDQVLFSIANFKTLWAEFRIYHAQQSEISADQTVNIHVNDQVIAGKIAHIIPALNKPYQLARVQFNNEVHGLSPGLLVEGHIVTASIPVTLAVMKSAIQSMGEQQGVFVQQGDQYKFTPLQLGRSDDAYAEVLSGLEAKQSYVSKNSYLIKADIEKSEAEHEH